MARETPTAGRPRMPEGYGIETGTGGLLPWSYVEERMSEARNFWVATCRPDGRPHAMPVWGVWLAPNFYFGTDRQSRKSRNLLRNPAAVVHLESGNNVVILEGTVEEASEESELSAVNREYHGKYGMRVSDAPGDVVIYRVRPHSVLAWREQDFPRSATRWRLGRAR